MPDEIFGEDMSITAAPTPPAFDAARNPELRGVTTDTGKSGVIGVSHATKSLGLLGGRDRVFRQNVGVYGESGQQGVFGHSTDAAGTGVYGNSVGAGFGVRGESTEGIAVQGQSFSTGVGVFGKSEAGEGVHGETNSPIFAAVAGIQLNPASTGAGVYGEHRGTGPAGFFKGDVLVTGDIKLINADCAEDFDIAGLEKLDPGSVMVIDSDGSLRECDRAYDKCVAGVISGAGKYKPAIVLDKQESSKNRMPIALMGKVYCKVDASYGAIEVGDLLTTSPTLGHAMKANDPMKAFGSVIGKALRPLDSGEGLIPILIALQ
jgi:hypothetical protein